MLKTALASLLTVKILAPAAALAAVGGITLASTAGTPSAPPVDPPVSDVTVNQPSQTGKPTKTPAYTFAGLCKAYTAGAANENGKALDSMAFKALANEAGGPDKIPAYCADLLADQLGKPAGVPSADPSTPSHPTASPTERPTPPVTTPAHPTPPPHATGAPGR